MTAYVNFLYIFTNLLEIKKSIRIDWRDCYDVSPETEILMHKKLGLKNYSGLIQVFHCNNKDLI